ncbi:MAG: pseudouridine synthase [Candidatus Omnitrophota bacterium]
MRLQVFLSNSGICSRRAAFDLIRSGEVEVNHNLVTEPSFPIDPDKDEVRVKNKKISLKKKDYLLLNKPKGVVTTRKDRFAKHTVYDYLPKDLHHLFSVGRLDQDSEGLLIFTNDGELSFRLMHPRFLVDKEYEVIINKPLKDNDKLSLEQGIIIDSQRTSPAKIINTKADKRYLKIIIHEGKKRQIRRMFLKLGYLVVLLRRIAYGPLKLGNLGVAKFRRLEASELGMLFKCVGL